MANVRFPSIFAALLLASCSPVQQAAGPSAASAASPQAASQPTPSAGGTLLACTPIEDRAPPAGQVSVAQPFVLRLDRYGRPVRFEGSALPARIPFQVDKIEPATGPQGLRVGAVIHYAAKDTQHEMYTTLAIMNDGTYQIGVMLRTPTQSMNAPAFAGHGTCVSKPA